MIHMFFICHHWEVTGSGGEKGHDQVKAKLSPKFNLGFYCECI